MFNLHGDSLHDGSESSVSLKRGRAAILEVWLEKKRHRRRIGSSAANLRPAKEVCPEDCIALAGGQAVFGSGKRHLPPKTAARR
jgi:hypothetical protein